MDYTIIIPARYAAQRFPGKLLKLLYNKPILQHVYEQAKRSQASHIVIATDDPKIQKVALGFGADVCLTSQAHETGTERLVEVVQLRGLPAETVIVNVQGDEPFIPPANIDQVAELLVQNPDCQTATLCELLESEADYHNPNMVKVVLNAANQALYFSRAPIPFGRIQSPVGQFTYRHIGLYAYRAEFLSKYSAWPPSPLEQIEYLEQLRTLWHGGRICVALAAEKSLPGIDTPDDLERYLQCQ